MLKRGWVTTKIKSKDSSNDKRETTKKIITVLAIIALIMAFLLLIINIKSVLAKQVKAIEASFDTPYTITLTKDEALKYFIISGSNQRFWVEVKGQKTLGKLSVELYDSGAQAMFYTQASETINEEHIYKACYEDTSFIVPSMNKGRTGRRGEFIDLRSHTRGTHKNYLLRIGDNVESKEYTVTIREGCYTGL